MTKDTEALREALKQCRDRFEFYAREHLAKTTATRAIPLSPDEIAATIRKAETNEAMVAMITAALATPARDVAPVGEETLRFAQQIVGIANSLQRRDALDSEFVSVKMIRACAQVVNGEAFRRADFPPAPVDPVAGEALHPDTIRLNALLDECWDLRSFAVPTGGDDADVAWKVVGHWMAEPHERVIAEGWSHDPRVAIDAALAALQGPAA